MKVNVTRGDLEFNKLFKLIDFEELSEQISYYPITIELIEKNEENNTQELIASLDGYYYDMDYIYDYNLNLFDIFNMVSGNTEALYSILFYENENVKIEYQILKKQIVVMII